jgi:hypothetical protein
LPRFDVNIATSAATSTAYQLHFTARPGERIPRRQLNFSTRHPGITTRALSRIATQQGDSATHTGRPRIKRQQTTSCIRCEAVARHHSNVATSEARALARSSDKRASTGNTVASLQ